MNSAEAPKIDSMLIAMVPEQIVLFKSIVESYDNLATLRTEDPTLHPGPRVGATLEMIAKLVHPEAWATAQ